MNKLLRKDIEFIWIDKYKENFRENKEMLTSAPLLALPKVGGTFVVITNASKEGYRGILM